MADGMRDVDRSRSVFMTDSDSPEFLVASGAEAPTITAAPTPPQVIVTGHGFLPGHGVTIRVIDPDETANYFGYTADLSGDLVAALPTTIPHGTLHISATDGRPDPTDETGVRWTNTSTITW
jgi:hypothetical protein